MKLFLKRLLCLVCILFVVLSNITTMAVLAEDEDSDKNNEDITNEISDENCEQPECEVIELEKDNSVDEEETKQEEVLDGEKKENNEDLSEENNNELEENQLSDNTDQILNDNNKDLKNENLEEAVFEVQELQVQEFSQPMLAAASGGKVEPLKRLTEEEIESMSDDELIAYVDAWYENADQRLFTAGMSDYDKLEAIADCVWGEFGYDYRFQSASMMILYGGGDCWASANLAISLCRRQGINESYVRIAYNDPGAASGHRNAAVYLGDKVYVLDYGVRELPGGFSFDTEYDDKEHVNGNWNRHAVVYQYDGKSDIINIPETYNGYVVKDIGTSFNDSFFQSQLTKKGSVFSYGLNSYGTAAKEVNIPKTIEYIVPAAFMGMAELKRINVDPDNSYFKSIDGALYTKDGKTLFTLPGGWRDYYYISPDVDKLGEFAFTDCESLKTVYIDRMTAPEIVGLEYPQTLIYGNTNITFYVPLGATGYDKSPWNESYYKVKYVGFNKLNIKASKSSVNAGNSINLSVVIDPSDAEIDKVTWSSSDTSIATIDKNGKLYGVKEGKATITATVKTPIYTSEGRGSKTTKVTYVVKVNKKNGLTMDQDKVVRYYKNGIVDETITGLYNFSGTKDWYYLKKGVQQTNYNSVVKREANNNWYCVKNGKIDFNFTGVMKRIENNKWYYIKKGQVDFSYTGVAKNPNNNKWFYVEKGELNWNFTGVAKRPENNKWFYINKGVLKWDYNGIAKNPKEKNAWYYIENGTINWNFTGVAKRPENKEWFYIKDGKLDWSYTGVATNPKNNKMFYVNKGRLDWSYSGMVYDEATNRTYVIKNGEVSKNFTGKIQGDDGWLYEFRDGEPYLRYRTAGYITYFESFN